MATRSLGYEDFLQHVKDMLPSVLPKNLKNAEITIQKKEMTDNKLCYGVSVRPAGYNTAPCIFMERFYQAYMNGMPMHSITEIVAQNIMRGFSDITPHMRSEVLLSNYDTIKNKIVMSVINAPRNKNLLEKLPHSIVGDMALIYNIMIDYRLTIRVEREFLETWNISENILYDLAKKNSKKMMKPQVVSMHDLMLEDIEKGKVPQQAAPLAELFQLTSMYRISNDVKWNGAAVIFYDDILDRLAKSIGTDLYVIPYSMNYIQVMNTSFPDTERLIQTIDKINKTTPEEELLSDLVYRYSLGTGTLIPINS